MKRLLLGALCASALFVTTGASAGASWCFDDPPVDVVTPQGKVVRIYVNDTAVGDHLAALQAASITYTATPHVSSSDTRGRAGDDAHAPVTAAVPPAAGTDVVMTILVPKDAGGAFLVVTTISTLPDATGTLLAGAVGLSGQYQTLRFTLETS
jgi:hypothetical protein